jgi:hypothetical protein
VLSDLTPAQRLKLLLLANGLAVSPAARRWITDAAHGAGLSSADYASTSGPILKLDDDVWVNAPVQDHNAFAAQATTVLDLEGDRLVIHDGNLVSPAWYCLQPQYHEPNHGRELMNLVVTHGDRVRLSPLRSCAMTCTFCNVPYDDPLSTYQLKPIDACVAALRVAVDDPIQPAHHILISGGTPKPKDVENHRELYRSVIESFPGVPVDIMMVPIPGVIDLPGLKTAGLNDLSINLEVYDRARQQEVARQKYNWGRDYYLDFIEQAADTLGPGRTRSMLLVGLESVESTLAGVEAIAQRGGVPVLSPFRPDPATPLGDMAPPGFDQLLDVYQRAQEIVDKYGAFIGPSCPPCTHNTLNFGTGADGNVTYGYPHPAML